MSHDVYLLEAHLEDSVIYLIDSQLIVIKLSGVRGVNIVVQGTKGRQRKKLNLSWRQAFRASVAKNPTHHPTTSFFLEATLEVTETTD